jgi:DNA-binding response OmpR family regulator
MKHVLLLEDNGGVASVLALLLKDANYDVTSAQFVADACKVLEQKKVDLLIADVLLSDGTALAAAEAAKRLHVPYFFMTGSYEQIALLDDNNEFYLGKPFHLMAFLVEVRDRIGQSQLVGGTDAARTNPPFN